MGCGASSGSPASKYNVDTGSAPSDAAERQEGCSVSVKSEESLHSPLTEPRCVQGKSWRKKGSVDGVPLQSGGHVPVVSSSAVGANDKYSTPSTTSTSDTPGQQRDVVEKACPEIRPQVDYVILERDLVLVEERVAVIARVVQTGPIDGLPILTAELAQLEATAKELESSIRNSCEPMGEPQRLIMQRLEQLFSLTHQTLADASKRMNKPMEPADSLKDSFLQIPDNPMGEASFSAVSKQSLAQLYKTNNDLLRIEQRVAEIATTITALPADEIKPLRTELAALESQAKKLETVGVDNVYTGELSSGKALAKQSKKEMLQRFDELFSLIDTLFSEMRTREGGGQ